MTDTKARWSSHSCILTALQEAQERHGEWTPASIGREEETGRIRVTWKRAETGERATIEDRVAGLEEWRRSFNK